MKCSVLMLAADRTADRVPGQPVACQKVFLGTAGLPARDPKPEPDIQHKVGDKKTKVEIVSN